MLNTIARIAGLSYLLIVVGYILSYAFVYATLVIPGNAALTAGNVMTNELLLRVGMTCDLALSVVAIIWGWAHYIILRTVNKELALLAFCLRIADAILAAVPILFSFISLQIINGETFGSLLKLEDAQSLAGLFLDVRAMAYTIPMVFTSLAAMVFMYLFLKSEYIPRLLAVFGFVAYLPLLIYNFWIMLLPKSAVMLLMGPSVLFEITIGSWLLIKGINVTGHLKKKVFVHNRE